MSSVTLIKQLVSIGRSGDFRAVEDLPGSGSHAEVLRFASSLRGEELRFLQAMPNEDLKAFVKALAVYENTVNGLGSVTALRQLFPLTQDNDNSLLDWVLSNTVSYGYYSHGAKSFAELEVLLAAQAARRSESERLERERGFHAKSRRAERATQMLLNSIRRGDLKAVQALLGQGATADTLTPEGVLLAQYAESLGHTAIANALRQGKGDVSPV